MPIIFLVNLKYDLKNMKQPSVKISDYTYFLPPEKIAKYPLSQRDKSKLLIYQNGNISDAIFDKLPDILPDNSLLVINDTKVVPARLFFKKESGAVIEIFCLEPHLPEDYSISFAQTETCVWKTVIGNAKKWKSGLLRHIDSFPLNAELVGKEDNCFIVRFRWQGGMPFSEVMEHCGNIPIPPYLNRATEKIDEERYQTCFAKWRGSVAAPTAGLHFTPEVMSRIAGKGITEDTICLHVGAGTFLPVKSEYIADHIMHSEPFSVTREFIKRVVSMGVRPIVAVGTTSMRTLESLYWLGIQCMERRNDIVDGFFAPVSVSQWEPYQAEYEYSRSDAFSALDSYMETAGLDVLKVRTSIIIVPTYRFRVVDVLITNFHQPQSTLLLLIAAFIGEDWRKVYDYALNNGFRFLSYGDSSILFRK